MSGNGSEKAESLIELLERCEREGASPDKIAEAMKKHIEIKARMKGVPMRGTLELTPLCNLDCKMCYVHLTKEQLANEKCGLMSGAQWIGIIQQAIDMGMLEATLTGGEALLHPDFEEIFLFLEANSIYVNLKSNGLLLTEKRIEFLKAHHLSSIQITLYGCDDDSYERVTGRRVFSQVIASIEHVKQSGIPLEVVITPSKYIWDDMERLLRFVDSMGVKYTVNPGLIDPLEETGRAGEDHDLTLEQYIEILKMRASIGEIQITPPCLEDVPKVGGNNQERAEGMRCAAGRSLFSVTWRGDVMPCRALENISFDGLNIPFSEGWAKINEAVRKYPFPRECVGCDFEGLCPVCVIQHGMGAEPGHANKAICHRAQRLVEEGFLMKVSR